MADDCELIRRAKTGDDDAYAELVDRHQSIAFRAAYLVTGNAQDAEDSTQEGLMKAHAAIDRFQIGQPFRPWLLRIVTNAAKDRKRVSNRRNLLSLKLQKIQTDHLSIPTPENATIEFERRETIVRLLNEMTESDRILLTYRYFLDLSTAEIATTLNSPASTIRSRLLRARNRLRTQLESLDQTQISEHNQEGTSDAE